MDRNPLEVTPSKIKSEAAATNKRGRPVNAESIKFSPQPKSAIIAQFLREKSFEQPPKQWPDIADADIEFSNIVEENNFKQDEKIEIQVEVVWNTDYESRTNTKIKAKLDKKPKKQLKVPIDKQEKRFACDFPNCSYAAKLSCNLIKHKRIHTSEKPYICDQCPFRTNFINSLKVHRRIHTAEKPYSCEHCGYRCNTSSNLKKHKMYRHPEVAKI